MGLEVTGRGIVREHQDIYIGGPEQALPQLTGGDELALPPREGGVIHREGHLNGGGGDLDKFDGLHGGGIADSVANGNVSDAAHGNDVAGRGLGDGRFSQPVKLIERDRLGLLGHGVRGRRASTLVPLGSTSTATNPRPVRASASSGAAARRAG